MKRLLPHLIFLLSVSFAFGQDTDSTKSDVSIPPIVHKSRWLIQFKPLQTIFVEFPVFVEYNYGRYGFGIELAYRPAYKSELPLIQYEYIERLWENYRALNYFNPLQNAVTVGTFHKTYFDSWNATHIKLHFFYRHWWFNEKETEYNDHVRENGRNVQGYQFKGVRTENQDIYGLKSTFGGTFSIRTKLKHEVVLEPYVGLGYRYKTYHYQTWDGEFWGEPIDYVVERGHEHIFTLQIGIAIGFANDLGGATYW